MPQGNPKSGELYRHFKQNLYQVVTTAKHTETGEILVIYQALYGDFGVYARPLSMFISEVDRKKYPKAGQRYRFMLLEENAREIRGETNTGRISLVSGHSSSGEEVQETASIMQEEMPENRRAAAAKKDVTELLMEFYDADTNSQRYDILLAMQKDITDIMIDNMAVVLDVVIPEGDLYGRFEELKRCLSTRQKYELPRL
ncbi:MAG: DUF1653 domain-containing protein [Lachnospiraceae bacterium]|jgi:hypothetical protein|nr:DUF1653 domain-containing protein [Lachnospiraceae bacterium]